VPQSSQLFKGNDESGARPVTVEYHEEKWALTSFTNGARPIMHFQKLSTMQLRLREICI
jgi:hypothetical protein